MDREKGSGPQGRHPGARKAIAHNRKPPFTPPLPTEASTYSRAYPRRRRRDDTVRITREGPAWLIVAPNGHGWLHASRREAIRDWLRMSKAGLLPSAPITFRVTIDDQAEVAT
jgi:hypothetical protein